jgi:hypothetical protein
MRGIVAGVAGIALLVSTSCSTMLTKFAEPPLLPRAPKGLGHAFTGFRCEWVYLATAAMTVPPAMVLVLFDAPLSAVADVVVLPLDLAVNSKEPWSIEEGCGVSLH